MQDSSTYEETFKIRSSEVHPNQKATLVSICDIMQEAAGNHALQLNFDIASLQKRNLTWVLHRLHVQMDRFPEWRDEITIKTWPSSGDTLRAYRDFLVLDDKEREIGRALSYWLMLNVETRKPVRMPDEILDMAPRNISHVLNVKKERAKAFDDPEFSKLFHVRKSDLDLNNHVNNVWYIDCALEVLPEASNILEIDIEFRAECNYGDNILSQVKRVGKSNSHILRHENSDKIVAVAKTRSFMPSSI